VLLLQLRAGLQQQGLMQMLQSCAWLLCAAAAAGHVGLLGRGCVRKAACMPGGLVRLTAA
jgi:hypothetical protein